MCALEKTHALEGHGAEAVLDALLAGRPESGACITCSFQAEDVVVLHLLRERVPDVPVLFLDTGYHFAETYEYRDRMTQEWSLNLVCTSRENNRTAGIGVWNSLSRVTHEVLPTAQGRALDEIS